ncbi:Fic family protein [Mucilaginibacter humi]|uniref:Fic family protein n=1 Tax=Mucilaginibacter humi TaxID=2732510 RepID=UPI001FE5D22E|nr:Fic family protein [Mucilaginibacter humi]
MYIHQLNGWPVFTWNDKQLSHRLSQIRYGQGKILGQMNMVGFTLKEETILQTLTLDITKSSEIEGDMLDPELVRSSVAKHLGIDIGGLAPTNRHIEGVVEMMLDATQKYNEPLSKDRLYSWQSALFPTGRSGLSKINVGQWRDGKKGLMQVVSGAAGKEKIHFEAPPALVVDEEIARFLTWFESNQQLDPVLKAAIAHLWFVTIHPFEDGNGRITRAITDMQLARADGTGQRFYSMSAQIQKERNAYYNALEVAQKGTLDITNWLVWFLDCLNRAMNSTDSILAKINTKARFWDAHRHTVLNMRQQKCWKQRLMTFMVNLTYQNGPK